ncbi:MAG: transposase family protein [Eubacterium sp.]|nr:transposase family protein [Eubacterium sp.]
MSFPKKLYSNEYVRNFVLENKGKMNTKDIAKEVGLSERRVRQILKEEK